MLSTQPITWAMSLAIAVLVPRYLGDVALGQYGVPANLATLVSAIATLGLQNHLTRQVALDPKRAGQLAWCAALLVTCCAIVINAPILLAVVVFDVSGLDPTLTAMAMCAALSGLIQGVFLAVLFGQGRNGRAAFLIAAGPVLNAVVGLTVLLLGGGVYGYAFGFLVGSAAATALVVRASALPPTRDAIDAVLARQLVHGGLPFLGWNVALRVRSGLDVVITGVLLQASVAGWLVAAYRIINVTVFIPTVITTPLLPALARCKSRPGEFRSLLGQSLSGVILLTVPVAASIFALAPSIPDAMGWPTSLDRAVPVMRLLAFQQPLVAIDMVLGVSLIALGLERRWLRIAIIGAIFNPLLNLAAIPLAQSLFGNGAMGAAAVELATECIFFAGALRLTPPGLLGRDDLIRAGRIALAGVALVVVATELRRAGLPIAFVGGGLAYLAAGAGLGVVGPRQIRAVRLALRPA